MDLSTIVPVLLTYYRKHPNNDAAFLCIQPIILSQIRMENPQRLIFILFKTELCSVILSSPKVHSSKIGDRLLELSLQEDEVKEFLTEMVDGWSDYCEELNAYNCIKEYESITIHLGTDTT